MARKLKSKSERNRKSERKRRRERKDAIPFSHVRKQIPKVGGPMKDKTVYNRKQKHSDKGWE